jgi:ketosteroid isomerase-like protein
MGMIGESPERELLSRCFDAFSRGDLSVLEDALAEDARWRTVWEGETNCQGRDTIIAIMSRNVGGRLRGRIDEMVQHGQRVVVAFRPEHADEEGDRPLDGGVAYMVVTLEDGHIVELKGCPERGGGFGHARTGVPPAPVPPPW